MPAILRRLPFTDTEDAVRVGAELVRIRPFQIIVWISITRQDVLTPTNLPRFPALLDTGHNHNLSIQADQLQRWAGLRAESLPILGAVREGGRRLPLHTARAWLHPNVPGQRDQFADSSPFSLKLAQGIVVYPPTLEFPPLPLLGLRALVRNHLSLSVDGRRREATVRTARRFWFFTTS